MASLSSTATASARAMLQDRNRVSGSHGMSSSLDSFVVCASFFFVLCQETKCHIAGTADILSCPLLLFLVCMRRSLRAMCP